MGSFERHCRFIFITYAVDLCALRCRVQLSLGTLESAAP